MPRVVDIKFCFGGLVVLILEYCISFLRVFEEAILTALLTVEVAMFRSSLLLRNHRPSRY